MVTLKQEGSKMKIIMNKNINFVELIEMCSEECSGNGIFDISLDKPG